MPFSFQATTWVDNVFSAVLRIVMSAQYMDKMMDVLYYLRVQQACEHPQVGIDPEPGT